MMDQAEAVNLAQPKRESTLERMATRNRAVEAQAQAEFSAALRVAFGRMSADCSGLDAVVQDVTIRQGALAEVLDLTETGMFLALLDGQGERMGLLMACPAVLAGMVEAQTTGRVEQAVSPPRKPSRTDAALLSPMIDAFLRLVEQRCGALPQARLVSGYVYGSFLDDPRPLGLMLDDGGYHILHLRVALGFGAKAGDWFLILPEPDPAPACADDTPEGPDPEADWQDRLRAAVGGSAVMVDAVLVRLQITLTEALRLRPGDILRLPESTLETLTLESIGQDALGIGRLGQARGQRAVRLTADPGILTDAMGATASCNALSASILPFVPPQAAFVPDDASGEAAPESADVAPRPDA